MTVKYFLDTHSFIWAHTNVRRLSPKAKRILIKLDNKIALSVISVWEIVIKYAQGKLLLPEPPERFIQKIVDESGYDIVPLRLQHSLLAASLPDVHHDPFDRMLVCQAIAENATIITADQQIQKYPVRTVW